MMKKYLIILLLIVGYVSINAQDQGVLSLSQLSSANATDAYYVSTADSGDFHVRWSTLYNDVYNYYPDRLTGLDTVDNNYYLIVNKDSVAYKIKWSVFLDSLNVDVYDSVRGIVNDTANVLRIEWSVDINDSLGRFWDSVEVEGYVNDTLNYYIDSVSIIDTINSIINDSLGRFWDSVEVKNYVNDTINYYIDSTATIDTIKSLISDSADSFTLDYVTSKGNTTTNDITVSDVTLDTANVSSGILFSDGSSIDQAKVDSAFHADTSDVTYETKYSRNIADILWFGNVYGDTGDFNRIIVDDLEILDTVESLRADGEAYFIFGKDDYSPLWEFQRDGDNLDLYSNTSTSTVAKFNATGRVELDTAFITYAEIDNYIDSASTIDTINSIVNSKIYLNKPFSTYTSNSVTISCDSSGYSEIDISGDLTINFNPLPSTGEMSSWTIMINGDATARDLTIQESGTAIDSLYWSNANELDSIPANDTIVVGANINNSGIWFMNYLKRGN
jgi:hypothetical protein